MIKWITFVQLGQDAIGQFNPNVLNAFGLALVVWVVVVRINFEIFSLLCDELFGSSLKIVCRELFGGLFEEWTHTGGLAIWFGWPKYHCEQKRIKTGQ